MWLAKRKEQLIPGLLDAVHVSPQRTKDKE